MIKTPRASRLRRVTAWEGLPVLISFSPWIADRIVSAMNSGTRPKGLGPNRLWQINQRYLRTVKLFEQASDAAVVLWLSVSLNILRGLRCDSCAAKLLQQDDYEARSIFGRGRTSPKRSRPRKAR